MHFGWDLRTAAGSGEVGPSLSRAAILFQVAAPDLFGLFMSELKRCPPKRRLVK